MNRRHKITWLGSACLLVSLVAAQSAEPVPPKELPIPGETFEVEGRQAFVMLPADELRQEPQPWVWYAPTLPGLPDQHEKWMHEQFLAAGVAVAGVDVGESYGSPQGQEWFTAFYRQMTERRGFAPRPCLLGRSRGGLMVCSWAVEHPEWVAGLAGIYPVLDLRAYPGLERAAGAYGLTAAELARKLDEHNPIQRVAALAKAQAPVFIIHGDIDAVVPLETNSAELLRRYHDAGQGDRVELVVAQGQGHNFWEGFFRCQELVDFAIRRACGGAEPQDQKPE